MSQVLRSTYYFLRLGRPLFLFGGFILHGLGVVMALYSEASLDVAVLIWGQIAITSIQLMTHYSNDYFDLPADRANTTPTRWSGGSRILAEGFLNPRVGLGTAILAGIIALGASFWLAFGLSTGPLTLPLLLLAITLAWGYSSPPLWLNGRGLGELTGGILITGLTPLVGFYLQAGRLALLPFLAVFPLACLQFSMLLVINYPDAEGDAAADKRTLLTFLGPERSARVHLIALILAYGTLPFLVLLGLPVAVAIALFLLSPLAIWLGWRMQHRAWADPTQWNSLGFWHIGLLMASTGAEFLAFLWLL